MKAVTVCVLVYRDLSWLSFVLDGLAWARNTTPHRVMIVGNDPAAELIASGRLDMIHRSADPSEHYIKRVYRAWNAAILAAQTDWVVPLNSDMYVSDFWLDALVEEKTSNPKSLPCGLLVESGRIASAMPEHVKDFGKTPLTFDTEGFRLHAASLRASGTGPGRLFQPVLFDKAEFFKLGGYPIGNVTRNGLTVSGDLDLFNRYRSCGFEWVTCLGSVVYHVQEGEMRS